MDCEPRRNIEKSGSELYSVCWSLEEGDEDRRMLVHREQVQTYFQFDALLRQGKGCPPFVPCGYPQFCDAYAHQTSTPSHFATFKQDEHGIVQIDINGHRPTYAEVLGPDADLRSQEDREGGRALNSAEAETSESMLWDAADRVTRQHQNEQRGYSTHRDRRGDLHCKNRGSLTERIINRLPFEDGCSKCQYHGKERLHTIVDEDRFSSDGVPVEYKPIGTAGPSCPPVVNKEEHLYGDEDGTYDEEVGEEDITTGQEIVAERPVEDNPVEDQIKPAENKGKAVDRVWTSLLAMW